MLSFKKLINSFRFSFRGIFSILRTEQNFRIHLVIALVVILLGWWLEIKVWQWIALIFLILLVLILEMLNTAFERLVDMLKPRIHIYARDIKNIMSAMVLITAISAIIIGVLIFYPYLKQ